MTLQLLDSPQPLTATETTRFRQVWQTVQIAEHALRKRADLRVGLPSDISHQIAYLYFSLNLMRTFLTHGAC
jgi:hypothetical protein